MTEQANNPKKTADAIFEALEKPMINGYSRWLDEKDYEDINDYAVLFTAKVVELGGEFIKMTKRPFGFQYKLGNVTIHVSISNNRYGYKSI